MRLRNQERGATMVFGIFFAVFLIASVYALYGTIETVLFRQRVQDAADAAAFSAAVVNARGMNLIALINMTMAVVLSVLVGLRLAETLGYISIGICLALASVTFGATASAVPPLQTATKLVATAAEKVQKPIENILKVLHGVSKVTAAVVPVGSNTRVIDLVASQYDAYGVAIPARLTLPVEDDDFGVLCTHAGKIASELALLPLSPLLPGRVKDALGDVTGKIAAAGAGWFCGLGGKPPDLNPDDKDRWIDLPRFASQQQCEDAAKQRVDTKVDEQATVAACNLANFEQLSSVPDRLGRCREGEAICPTDCSGAMARDSCPPPEFDSCPPEHAQQLISYAAVAGKPTQVTCEPGSPYDRRRQMARSQCLPASEGGRAGLGGFRWLERDVTREFAWNKRSNSWVEDANERVEEPVEPGSVKDKDHSYPCGRGGFTGPDYQRRPDLPLCESPAHCETSAFTNGVSEAPCSRVAPQPHQPQRFTERSTQVTEVLRCVYKEKLLQIETPKMDLSKDLGKSGKKGKGPNTNPFRLETDVLLGASDFQLRSVVVSKSLPAVGQRGVAIAWWNGPRGDSVEGEGGVVATSMTKLGRIALAQAEYYFDWTGLSPAPSNQNKPADVTEWMWNMGWRARLRPFRLRHDDADAEPPKSKQAGAAKAANKPKQALDCGALPKGAGAFCGDAQGAVGLSSIGGL